MSDETHENPPAGPADQARARLAALPIRVAGVEAEACSAAEPFALRVLGDAMEPEFVEGDILVIEPEGHATDASYVLAWWRNEWTFRQLRRSASGWSLVALNPAYAAEAIPDLGPVRGVVIQKSKPGRRRSVKRYVD